MYHGHYAAINIHQRLRQQKFGVKPAFVKIQEAAPMICLAIAGSAAGYNEVEGVISGREVLELYFREDLGLESRFFSIFSFCDVLFCADCFLVCWNYLGLGRAIEA